MQSATTTPESPGPSLAARSGGSSIPVLALGLATTALALGAVYALNVWNPDSQIMGRYLNYVIPYGAILVGVVASSGYGIGSWWRGVKISGGLLFGIMGLQVVAYFAAQYVEFAALGLRYEDGTPVGFLSYFHWSSVSFAWYQDDGTLGAPVGMLGYGIRALEVIGFAAGSLAAPALLRGKAYCEPCQRYMASRSTRWIPASIAVEKIKKKDTERREEHDRAQQAAYDDAMARLDALFERGTEGDASGFAALLAEDSTEGVFFDTSLPARIKLRLSACPGCSSGHVKASLCTIEGRNVKEVAIGEVPLRIHFVDEVCRR